MLAPKPSRWGAAWRLPQQVPVGSYERRTGPATPTRMVFANAFILWLLGAAAFVGVAAVVQKRSRRERDVADRSSFHAC